MDHFQVRLQLELAIAAGGRDSVGARQMEYRHVEVSIRSVGGAYRSYRWQLGEEVRWRTAVGVQTRRSVN